MARIMKLKYRVSNNGDNNNVEGAIRSAKNGVVLLDIGNAVGVYDANTLNGIASLTSITEVITDSKDIFAFRTESGTIYVFDVVGTKEGRATNALQTY